MSKYVGESFLSRLYRDMHTEDIVINSSNIQDNKYEKIKKYLSRLENVHKKLVSKDKLRILKHFYYEKYIIKSENITDEYFKHLEEIALNRGYGHIEYSNRLKKQEKETIINDQKKSLDSWIDYFSSEDSNMYLTWFKYYAFQSIVKLGSFDKTKNVYNQRTENTISIFPELNREALAMMYDYFQLHLNGQKEFDDKVLEKLINGGSFRKIYAYLIKKLSLIGKENTDSSEGKWIKYNKGTDHIPLVKSLEGKGTGWCTAGEQTAKKQLSDGDFYVYYSLDEKGESTIPRIAIRMEGNKIAEIRGVAEAQNLESEMESILEEKLDEFPDKYEYKKKIRDMEQLTIIYKKYKNNEELTDKDLRFIYQLDGKIQGFGYDDDPRIDEIFDSRRRKKDLSKLLECEEDQIAINKIDYEDYIKTDPNSHKEISTEDILNGKIVYYESDLELSNLTNGEGIKLPRYVTGTLELSGLKNANGLMLPEYIGEDLYLNKLLDCDGIKLPNYVGGSLYLDKLISLKNLKLPNYVGGLKLSELENMEGFQFSKVINESVDLSYLETAKNVVFPETIGDDLFLYSLKSATNVTFPVSIGGDLELDGLLFADGLVLPKYVGRELSLCKLKSAKGLKLPETVGNLLLSGLETVEGLILPKNISGCLALNKLEKAEGLVFPNSIGGYLDLSSLKSIEGLKLPNSVDGYLSLRSITSAKGLVLPNYIGGTLSLGGLISTEGLVLPNKINGHLSLSGIEYIENFEFPSIIKSCLFLNNLKTAKNLKLPERIGEFIFLDNLTSIDGLIIPDNFDFDKLRMRNDLKQELIEKYKEKNNIRL